MSTNDTVGVGKAGITYKIRGDDTFKGKQNSEVSCTRRSEEYCKVGDGTTGTITTTVWLTPSEGSDGNYALSFEKLTYFIGDEEHTADIDAQTASINLYY
jgi:hypothetical protein